MRNKKIQPLPKHLQLKTTATETTQSDTETAQEETNSKEETQTNQEDAN